MKLSPKVQHRPSSSPFAGFEPLTGNYVYCPNQFFDVCLSDCSRGTVRIVAYILRQTLGWLDKQGNPLQQEIAITYRDLIQKAGVSRGAIGPALKEALDGGFITCSQKGSQRSVGQAGQSAVYRLRWGETGEYTRQLAAFSGFFAGEGHRTPVPNRFFDELIPNESLSVTKVVGAVIRHTVGYQNQFGGRRSSAPLSYTHLRKYTKLSDRSTLAQAIRHAQDVGYMQCEESGTFVADVAQQKAATYAIRWLNNKESINNSSKTRPASAESKNQTSNGSEIRPAERFKNQTSIKTTNSNNTFKQQTAAADQKIVRVLTQQGMDRRTAEKLTTEHAAKEIKQQLDWLDARKPTENRTGMLRKAIEDNWPKPRDIEHKEKRRKLREQQRDKDARQHQEDSVLVRRKQQRSERQQRLLQEWGSASPSQRRQWIQAAAQRETSARLADIIRREELTTSKPHMQILEAIAVQKNLPRLLQLDAR